MQRLVRQPTVDAVPLLLDRPERSREVLVLSLIIVAFLAVCLCIRTRYLPWGDEVQFADPAANLYYKLGFISTEWSNQSDSAFWSGNAPAYPVLLYLAFRTFHFSPIVARSLNLFMMAATVLLLRSAVIRSKVLLSPHVRLLMAAFVLCGYACYSCYANIRYDCLCLLLCAGAFLVCTSKKPGIRNVALFVLGGAMVLTNLQLPQFILLLAVIISYSYSLGFSLLWKLRCLGFGIVAGGAGLLLLYKFQPGAWDAFLATLQQQAGQHLSDKLHYFHYYFEYDLSLLSVALCLLAGLGLVRPPSGSLPRRALLAGLLTCTIVPAFFFFTRRFVFSSAWMVYVPAVIFLLQFLETSKNTSRSWKLLFTVLSTISIGLGLPKAAFGILNDWAVRNYSVVETFVAVNVGPKDVVLSDSAAYFAAKPRSKRIYGPGYHMTAEEKKTITLVITSPVNESSTLHDLGGTWSTVGQLVQESQRNTTKLLPIPSNFVCRLNVLRKLTTP